jgi:5,10-methylenetetrahydromethanopterin reductase
MHRRRAQQDQPTPLSQTRTVVIGVTAAPFIRSGPAVALELARCADRLGYDSFWVAEVVGAEAFSVLGATAQVAPSIGLGTGVLPMQVRTPTLLAMAAASLQAMAPDREILIGLGVSSPVVVSDWHGAVYPARPLSYVREFLTVLRLCLSGEPVSFAGDHFTIRKFRLGVELGARRPKIVLGALNERMLQLGGAEADGVLLNYLPASQVPWCVERVRAGGNATVYANVHVGVGDRDATVDYARFDLFSYVVVDAYAQGFARAGFSDEVEAVRTAYASGDRAAAVAGVSDRMLDAISIVGDEKLVASAVAAYREAGVDMPVVFPVVPRNDRTEAVESTLRAAGHRQHG